ncbi:YncE family protein [Amycolatopsis sp. CA-230715]|uniref:YncE family protein n=1 Tax=Amycolatopsis sp. CA-230715 TaxID=2745196 RepID=UPI001C033E8E|nr:YncE family protein [Amycolatopsis sp. CA-230715]QWF77914.1 hypothetical protein HUW46_01307 [Amycolatopsis sp. CA-230715]
MNHGERWQGGLAAAAVTIAAAGAILAGTQAREGIARSAEAAVPAPGCEKSAAPAQPVLDKVRTASLDVPTAPFGVVYGPKGGQAFVALGPEIGVLTGGFPPKLERRVALPKGSLGESGATGLAVTHDGQHLLVATGTGAIVLDAGKLASGGANPVLGTLTGTAGSSAVQVSVSPDDRFAFVSQEYGNEQTGNRGAVEVFDLAKALHSGFGAGSYVGHIVLGRSVVGTALSPDGKRLYATSEVAPGGEQGQLSVLDVGELESSPGTALLGAVSASCQPVRVAAAPDGRTVWVTARGSNALLAFDAGKLTTDPAHARRASVQVGTAPVGLTMTADGERVVTADSNRFQAPGASTGLSVVDTQAALAGRPALGRIPTGAFPRELALSPDGRTVLAANAGAKKVQAVDTATLP